MGKYGDWTRGEDEALLNVLGGTDVARAILRGEKKVAVAQPELLKRIARVQVSAVARFVAKDELATANVGWTGDNFKKLFLGKVEKGVGEANLVVHQLEQSSLDAPILAELGDKAEIQLARLFELLKKQSKGEQGVLLTNGYANIAYVRGIDGNLWAVGAYWNSDYGYWPVGAHSVEVPYRWHGGNRVLSRDSGS